MLSKTRCALVVFFVVAVNCTLCGGLYSQTPITIQRPEPTTPLRPVLSDEDYIAMAKAGNYSKVGLETLVKASATGAIPMLEKQFVNIGDPDQKAHIASVLVRLGDLDSLYWGYLVDNATKAVDSDQPDIGHYDQGGKPLTDESPEFVSWAASHHLSDAEAREQGVHDAAAVMFLAMIGDSRGVPVLQRGLLSPDPYIEIYSAQGLAQAKDADSAPLIIDACKRARPDLRIAIASQLVYFDDAGSRSAVDQYLPKDTATALRNSRAQGVTPF